MEVSQECGFSTVSHFHRIFRRRFGATPGEMRASIQKDDQVANLKVVS